MERRGRGDKAHSASQRLSSLVWCCLVHLVPTPGLCKFLYFERGKKSVYGIELGAWLSAFPSTEFLCALFTRLGLKPPLSAPPGAPHPRSSEGDPSAAHAPSTDSPLTFPGKPLQKRFPVTSRLPRPSCSFRFLHAPARTQLFWLSGGI